MGMLRPCDPNLAYRKEVPRQCSSCLLALLHECVVLRDALQRQLVHEVDLMGILHETVLEIQDCDGEGRRVHKNLPVLRQELDEVFNNGLELWAQ